jgi:phenylacetate-coenzyme A ligase PaaK-like adenylate-forming protein
VGEAMAKQAQNIKLSIKNLNPRFIYSVLRALFLSKIHKRQILPKDLWSPKGIITGGTDTSIYKEEVKYYWGTEPLEIYGGTEGQYAVQNWNKKWMTFSPQTVFFEFIPEEDSIKSREDPSYIPPTVLMDEVEEGKVYEMVITQFYGNPLLRYRVGDTIKIVAMEDVETGVKLPQMVFQARIGETIDLASLARLTEKIIWQAISNTGVQYEDWSARKEYEGSQSVLRIYVELREEVPAADLERMIDRQLWEIDIDYRDIKEYLNMQPVRVHILPEGSFNRYYQKQVDDGADLAHLKPPHINASDAIIEKLLQQD